MTEIEGLWTVEVETMSGWNGSGVMVFHQGRVLGGSMHFFIVGSYTVRDQKLEAEVRCLHYYGQVQNAFGDSSPDFRVTLSGRCHGEDIVGKVHRTDRPELRLRMTRRAGFDDRRIQI